MFSSDGTIDQDQCQIQRSSAESLHLRIQLQDVCHWQSSIRDYIQINYLLIQHVTRAKGLPSGDSQCVYQGWWGGNACLACWGGVVLEACFREVWLFHDNQDEDSTFIQWDWCEGDFKNNTCLQHYSQACDFTMDPVSSVEVWQL